jgi:hypothetical protein
MKVWVVDEGEYENNYIVGIYLTKQSAIEHIKEMYSVPYRVEWGWDGEQLVGYFEAVPNYSTKHTAYYNFTEWEVE